MLCREFLIASPMLSLPFLKDLFIHTTMPSLRLRGHSISYNHVSTCAVSLFKAFNISCTASLCESGFVLTFRFFFDYHRSFGIDGFWYLHEEQDHVGGAVFIRLQIRYGINAFDMEETEGSWRATEMSDCSLESQWPKKRNPLASFSVYFIF